MTDQEKKPLEKGQEPQEKRGALSRRNFLKAAGTAIAGLVGASAAGCDVVRQEEVVEPRGVLPLPNQAQYPDVPGPEAGPPPGVMGFFTPHEALTVDALTATILPGSPEDPGAHEAGVVYYIDAALSYQNGFTERTYHRPPFGVAFDGESPPDEDQLPGLELIYVPSDIFSRYGWQTIMTPREIYRTGVVEVDRYAREQFGDVFTALTDEQKEQVVEALAGDQLNPLGDVAAQTFFEILRNHTIEGMFSDPIYRGNRDMVGWRLLGYPGAQRAYTPIDMHTEGSTREPQSLANMPVFNPGQPGHPNAVLPVSGTGELGPANETLRTREEQTFEDSPLENLDNER